MIKGTQPEIAREVPTPATESSRYRYFSPSRKSRDPIRSTSSTHRFHPGSAGSIDDQRIQECCCSRRANNYNSGVRMDSVDLLTQTSK